VQQLPGLLAAVPGAGNADPAAGRRPLVRLQPSVLAPTVLVAFAAILLIGGTWELPTMQHTFGEIGARTRVVNLTVDGLRCRGTSNYFLQKLGGAPGLQSVNTYVQEHRAEITYDPGLTTVAELRRRIEQPVTLDDGRTIQPFRVTETRE
jgi:hypothetical protein